VGTLAEDLGSADGVQAKYRSMGYTPSKLLVINPLRAHSNAGFANCYKVGYLPAKVHSRAVWL